MGMAWEQEPKALTETRLTHEAHRLATDLLVDAAGRLARTRGNASPPASG